MKALNYELNLKVFFSENLGDVSEEYQEHQDIKEMPKQYHGWWNNNMMGHCCSRVEEHQYASHGRGNTTE